MAMQLKHMVTVGLGLGVATALGYHFLSSPNNEAESLEVNQLSQLQDYEIVPAPSANANGQLVSSRPQLDNQFRSEVQPLQAPVFHDVDPESSYEELVSATQPALPISTETAEPLQLNADSGSDNSFSMELEAPSGKQESEFAFENVAPPAPSQFDVQAPASNIEMDNEFVESEVAIEMVNQTADDVTSLPQPIAVEAQESLPEIVDFDSLPEIVDFNSEQIKKSGSEGVWKDNPFINDAPVASVATKPALPSAEELPASNSFPITPAATLQSETPIDNNSVLSLNDETYGDRADVGESFQAMAAAAATPDSVQAYQQQSLVNEQASIQPVQAQQLALNQSDALKAVHHVEYGKTLSRRGAAYTARQEFLSAMQVIANSNDSVSGDNRHSKALRMALLAMEEARDFSVASPEQQIQMDVASVIESHRSNVLTKAQAATLSPTQAMNRYFARAQNQLDLAGGRNVVTAEVFYCMGKLHTMLNRNQKVLSPHQTAQSVVYHQAALLSDNQHHRSSNELGVLLARNGRLEQAKLLFERSLLAQPTVRTWQNLGEAHRRLGELDYANRAATEVQLLASGQVSIEQSNANSTVKWMPVDQFNAEAPVDYNQRVAELPAPPALTPANKPAPAKSLGERIKGLF